MPRSDAIADAKNRLSRTPWEAIRDFRARHDMAALDLDPDEIFGDVRDRSTGKDFSWDAHLPGLEIENRMEDE